MGYGNGGGGRGGYGGGGGRGGGGGGGRGYGGGGRGGGGGGGGNRGDRAFQLKLGQFTLHQTREKRSDKSPDFSGQINLDGRLHWISVWEKEGRNGTYFSGSIGEEYDNADGRLEAEQPGN